MSESRLSPISSIVGLDGPSLGGRFDVLRDERRMGKRRRQVCDVTVGGVVEQDDGLVAGEFAEPVDESGGPVVEHPVVSREVDQPPGFLIAKQAGRRTVTKRRPSRLVPFIVVMSSLVKSSGSVANTFSACQMPSTDCEDRSGWPGTGIPPFG